MWEATKKISRFLSMEVESCNSRETMVVNPLEVPHRGIGVNSGRKLRGDTPTIPEANRRTWSSPD